MTTGQRISEKRKSLGLSQETLGEKLGVSRQSIYKWERDASLPDIDKLIALSRLFSVPVGWLLGVEEDIPSPAADESPCEDWTERQEQLVEDVLRRYQAAQPSPKKSAWEKWSVRILVVMCAAMVLCLLKVNELERRYASLNSSVNNITSQTNSQLNSMADRIEQILSKASELYSDYSCSILDYDLVSNTITFRIRVIPKTYVEGLDVKFQIECAGEMIEAAAQEEDGHIFSADVACPLTDSTKISAIFTADGISQVQFLEDLGNLLRNSSPDIKPEDTAWHHTGEFLADGSFQIYEQYIYFTPDVDLGKFKTDLGIVGISSVDVGLFFNRGLVQWLKQCDRPADFDGSDADGRSYQKKFNDGYAFYYSEPVNALTAKDGDTLVFAARIVDEYGREFICPGTIYTMKQDQFLVIDVDDKEEWYKPSNYTF